MLTDISQFTKGILQIEGVVSDELDRVDVATNDNLEQFIAIYEPEYLSLVLGGMSDDFIAYVNSGDSDNESFNRLIEWFNGCVVSPIACYVYYWYVRQSQSTATPIGVTKNNSDNPIVSPNGKLVTAWNMMASINHNLVKYIVKNKSDYPGWGFDEDMLETINDMGI